MTTDTKAVARWDTQEVPEGMNHIRCAKYPDLLEYHYGVGGKGEHAYSWEDKPHRLVYDLTGMATEYRDEITSLRSALAAKSAEVEGLRLVVNRARHLAAWFSSGNTVPVHGTHIMKISVTSVMDDVYQLNQALAAMEKSND